jgi:NAD+ kinase
LKTEVHEHVEHALNDLVITQGIPTRLIRIRLSVDGRDATEYFADGLVVSTPVGSTAYSLSLGGPILTPSMRAFTVTPIAPHSLTNRPIVVSGQSVLKAKVLSHANQMAVVLDGQDVRTLDLEDEIEVSAAERPFLLVSHGDRSFFDLLRTKFHWGVPPNHGS